MRTAPGLALTLLLLLPAAAGAAPMQRNFEAVLALHSGALPTVFFFGAGTATLDVTGNHVNSLTLPAGALVTQVTTAAPGIEVRVDAANGTGVFSSTGGGWAGVMPVAGTLRICLGGGGCDATPLLDILLPLGVIGAGGTTATPGGSVQVSGAPWQTSPFTLSGPGFVSVFSGYQLGPASLTSSTALPGGFMLFVTPAFVSIQGVGDFDFVAELAITFVPEPGVSALVMSGLLGLALLRRR